ncbi:MAG TPA: hypothetical protein VNN77_08870 [candidate division Zixibacteria bacterium]|nr:hypothetical protein [candidate division Zixibacteria bacterium]
MSDAWINRLVVSGPAADVRAFAKAAVGFEPPDFDSPSDKPVKVGLSLGTLYELLPSRAKRRVPPVEDEPADLVCERLVVGKTGNAEKIYRFQLAAYEPDLLLTAVSRLFPRLVFVLGWVAPAVDEAASKLIRNGTVRRYRMPGKRLHEIYAARYEEWGEDCLDADIEGDWMALDEVVEHWRDCLPPMKAPKRRRNRRVRSP